MSIVYLNEFSKDPTYELTQWRGEQEWDVRICPDKASWRTVYLHWLAAEKKGVPCTGNSCFCKDKCSSSRIVTYCPAETYNYSSQKWQKKILVVNESMRSILDEDHIKFYFKTKRRGKFNSPVTYSVFEPKIALRGLLPFPIEPTLERVWGVRQNPPAATGSPMDSQSI